jgi:hypothetical protein
MSNQGDGQIGKQPDKAEQFKTAEVTEGAHAAMLNTVRDATVGGKTGSEAAIAGSNDVKALSTEQISRFSPSEVNALKPDRIGQMSSEQIGAFTPQQREQFTPEQNKAALGVMTNSILDKLGKLPDEMASAVKEDPAFRNVVNYVTDASKMNPEKALNLISKF